MEIADWECWYHSGTKTDLPCTIVGSLSLEIFKQRLEGDQSGRLWMPALSNGLV